MQSEAISYKRKCRKKIGKIHTPKAVTYHEQSHYCRFMIGHSLGRMGVQRRARTGEGALKSSSAVAGCCAVCMMNLKYRVRVYECLKPQTQAH